MTPYTVSDFRDVRRKAEKIQRKSLKKIERLIRLPLSESVQTKMHKLHQKTRKRIDKLVKRQAHIFKHLTESQRAKVRKLEKFS